MKTTNRRFLLLLLFLLPQGLSAFSDDTIIIKEPEMRFIRIDPFLYRIIAMPFYMLETEVTNKMYEEFIDNAKFMNKKGASKIEHIDYALSRQKNVTMNLSSMDKPVTNITLLEAESFCSWLSVKWKSLGIFRLPYLDEWMVAAYGCNRKYPWGFDKNEFLNPRQPAVDGTYGLETVTAYPKIRTPEGLYGMWGNAMEYVLPIGLYSPELRVHIKNDHEIVCLVGGSYKSTEWSPRKQYWGVFHNPHDTAEDLSFRVVLLPRIKSND